MGYPLWQYDRKCFECEIGKRLGSGRDFVIGLSRDTTPLTKQSFDAYATDNNSWAVFSGGVLTTDGIARYPIPPAITSRIWRIACDHRIGWIFYEFIDRPMKSKFDPSFYDIQNLLQCRPYVALFGGDKDKAFDKLFSAPSTAPSPSQTITIRSPQIPSAATRN